MKKKREDIATGLLGMVLVGGTISFLMLILTAVGVISISWLIVFAPWVIPTLATIIYMIVELRRG